MEKYRGGSGESGESLGPTDEVMGPIDEAEEKRRPGMPMLSVKQRRSNFSQVELGYSDQLAIEEAMRCLRCDLEERE